VVRRRPARRRPDAPAAPAPAPRELKQGLKVLVVEDEGPQAMFLRRIVENLGHQVVGTAADGEEACRLREKHQPDLVLMDIRLPKMDGLAAARAMNQAQPLPIILVTAFADQGFRDQAKEAGVYSYLVKPVESQVLGPAMEIAFQSFARERELQRQVVDLRQEIETRKLTSRAAGILMERLSVDEEAARRRLDQQARAKGVTLAEAAQSVIIAQELSRASRRTP
jgi:response regulator NasT